QVGRHRRQLRNDPLLDALLSDAHFFALVVGQDHDLAFLAEYQPGDRLAVRKVQRRGAEGLIDIAIGVDEVFEQAVDAANAEALPAETASNNFPAPAGLRARLAAMTIWSGAGAVGRAFNNSARAAGWLISPSDMAVCSRRPNGSEPFSSNRPIKPT